MGPGRLRKRLRRYRRKALHKLHLAIDRSVHGDSIDLTAASIQLDDLAIDGANREAGRFYLPTHWALLSWLHAGLPGNKADWTFVDLGAGLGRATLAAARQPYAHVVGVEFAGELAATARAVISVSGGIKAGSVEILQMDAARYELPDGPVIVFMFDPFHPPVIDEVARSIARSYAREPRPIIIAYLLPSHAALFDALDCLNETRLRWGPALLFRLLSLYPLKVYATPEGLARWQ
jgi:SAM-dependent methyltransferase